MFFVCSHSICNSPPRIPLGLAREFSFSEEKKLFDAGYPLDFLATSSLAVATSRLPARRFATLGSLGSPIEGDLEATLGSLRSPIEGDLVQV